MSEVVEPKMPRTIKAALWIQWPMFVVVSVLGCVENSSAGDMSYAEIQAFLVQLPWLLLLLIIVIADFVERVRLTRSCADARLKSAVLTFVLMGLYFTVIPVSFMMRIFCALCCYLDVASIVLLLSPSARAWSIQRLEWDLKNNRKRRGCLMAFLVMFVFGGAVLFGAALSLKNCPALSDALSQDGSSETTSSNGVSAANVRLSSVMGLNDSILAQTNRFLFAKDRTYFTFRLSEPFMGFVEAGVFLDELGSRIVRNEPCGARRLRSVRLQRKYPPMSSSALVQEGDILCKQIASLLEVPASKVHLPNVGYWIEHFGGMGRSISFTDFRLANCQKIQIVLKEASYVVRNGELELVGCPMIEMDVTFNAELVRGKESSSVVQMKSEHLRELSFGPDCTKEFETSIKNK